MRTLKRKIRVDATTAVSSVWSVPDDWRADAGTAVALAHGAGNDMHSPFLRHVHAGLARRGLLVVRFNFPYKEAGRRPPDPAPRLETTWRAVLARLRADPALAPARLFAAGKSMGGRMASHVAAAGEALDGLIFFGYPLHPPGRPERERSAHLDRVPCPMLFIQGSRDRLCDLERLRVVLSGLELRAGLHVVEGGDHSFAVPKRMGRDQAEVWDEVVGAAADWIAARA